MGTISNNIKKFKWGSPSVKCDFDGAQVDKLNLLNLVIRRCLIRLLIVWLVNHISGKVEKILYKLVSP